MLEYEAERNELSGRHQLAERITNNIVYSESAQLFFVSTNDSHIYALRRYEPKSQA